jgi:hypothetical protein
MDHDLKIFAPRQSLLLSPIALDWKAAFAFGQRQYRMIWTHYPVLWLFAALCFMAPIVAAIVACFLLTEGSVIAAVVLAVSIAAGEIRLRCRRRIAAALWGDLWGDLPNPNKALSGMVERWLRPVWWVFHAACVLTAPLSRRFRWAGIDYLVLAPQDVRVSRPDMPSP